MTGPPSSSGLGFRPFKAATRVRIPLGAHNRIAHAPVEESGRPHRPVKAEIAGSKPVGRADLPGVSRSRRETPDAFAATSAATQPRNSSRSRFTSTVEIAIRACNPAETSADNSGRPAKSSRNSPVGACQPGAHHRRLGAGKHDEERHGAHPEPEPRPPRPRQRRAERHDRRDTVATFSPEDVG